MKLKTFLLTTIMTLTAFSLYADDFFCTGPANRLFNLGVRAGLNSSNRTFNSNAFNKWNVNSWGTGIDVGVIANLNFRDYLAIQPGIFFESRSGNYSYSTDYYTNVSTTETFNQMGHVRSYNLVVPIMALVRFNLSDILRWHIEAGPYGQLKIHSSDGDKITVVDVPPGTNVYRYYTAESNTFDVGVKMGTAITLWDHYYFGIHYMAGLLDVWKMPKGGKNKAWTFTLGYDF